MSETYLAPPSGFRFFKVLCNLGVIRPDGADPDKFPDFRTQGGQVTIVSNAPRIRSLAVSGAGRMVNLPDEIFTIAPSTGTLLDSRGEVLYLLDPLSDDVDPRGFTYTATVKSATDTTPWTVTFGGDVQLPAEVDLVRMASIAPSAGTATLEQRVATLEASAGIGGSGGGGTGMTTKAVQDVVGAMVTGAGGTYDDAAGTITLPAGGASSAITADDTPAAPAEGESASYLVTSAVSWPAGLVWSTDPDGGVAPTITGTALVSMFTVDGVTRAIMGATFPAPPDTTLPTAGTLAASAITSGGFTLTVTGASDETALHATPYAFSTDNGVTYSAWQASSVYAASGLTAETTYTCIHKVRDAAGNVATGTATTTTTTAVGSGGPYAWARRVTPEPTDPIKSLAPATTHTYTVAGTAGRLLVAGFSVDKDAGTITVSAGWNLVAYYSNVSVSGALAWRVATGSDDITWTLGGGTELAAICDVHEFTGYVSPTVDVFATFPNPPNDHNRTSMVVTAGNATADGMAVAIAGQDTVSAPVLPTHTVASGYTMRSWNSPGTYGNSLLMAAKNVSAGGSTEATFSFGSTNDQSFGIVAVFKG